MTEIGSKSKRWIAVSVDQASHPVVGMHRPPPKPADPKRHAVAPYVAWQMLLIEAAWQDHKTVVGNTPMTIKRGQTLGSISYLASKWNWTLKTVRGFLDLLIDEGMIERGTQKGRMPSLLTICNYEKYQSPPSDEGHAKGTQRASEGHEKGNTLTNNTNIQTSSPRERDQSEIAGLNGSTSYWIEKIAESFSQWAPDHESARRILVQMSEAYGAEALASAVIDFDAAVAARKAKPSASLLSRYCETARRRLKNSPEAKLSSATSAHAEALAVLERRRQRKLEGVNNG